LDSICGNARFTSDRRYLRHIFPNNYANLKRAGLHQRIAITPQGYATIFINIICFLKIANENKYMHVVYYGVMNAKVD
jgi:hypothetical protein